MMGRLKGDQGQLFYELHLSDAVPEDHLVRKIDAALDLSWLRRELCSSLFVHGSPVDRAGADDANACRGLCFLRSARSG